MAQRRDGGRGQAAGILVETRVAGHQVDVAVAGIGINVSPAQGWPPGVSATTIGDELAAAGRDPQVDRSELLAVLLERIESVYGSVGDRIGSGRGAAARHRTVGPPGT